MAHRAPASTYFACNLPVLEQQPPLSFLLPTVLTTSSAAQSLIPALFWQLHAAAQPCKPPTPPFSLLSCPPLRHTQPSCTLALTPAKQHLHTRPAPTSNHSLPARPCPKPHSGCTQTYLPLLLHSDSLVPRPKHLPSHPFISALGGPAPSQPKARSPSQQVLCVLAAAAAPSRPAPARALHGSPAPSCLQL